MLHARPRPHIAIPPLLAFTTRLLNAGGAIQRACIHVHTLDNTGAAIPSFLRSTPLAVRMQASVRLQFISRSYTSTAKGQKYPESEGGARMRVSEESKKSCSEDPFDNTRKEKLAKKKPATTAKSKPKPTTKSTENPPPKSIEKSFMKSAAKAAAKPTMSTKEKVQQKKKKKKLGI